MKKEGIAMAIEQFVKDLKPFFSDSEEYISELPDEEKKINEETVKLLSSQEELIRTSNCARISHGDNRCGFAKSGRIAYVNNARNDKQVRATVRVHWRQGINSGQYDCVHTIPAGSRKLLGCTRGVCIPVADYSYRVVGCEVL